MTWADAEAACARDRDGGHLVTVTSEDEQAALEHFALNRLRQLPPGYPEGNAATSFFGLRVECSSQGDTDRRVDRAERHGRRELLPRPAVLLG